MLQLWTIVLGTVTQYSYLFVISPFAHKKVHPFGNSLAFSIIPPPRAPPSPLTKVNLWGEVRGWTGVYLMEKASEKQVSLDFCP